MFEWIKSELEELRKLSSEMKKRMKDDQVKEARSCLYSKSISIEEAREKFPLLSTAEIVQINIEESKKRYDDINKKIEAKMNQSGEQLISNINKYGIPSLGPGILGQIDSRGHKQFTRPLTPSQSYGHPGEYVGVPRFTIEIKKRNGHILSLDDKKELVKQLREIESKLINEIREEEEKSEKVVKKVKKRKLI